MRDQRRSRSKVRASTVRGKQLTSLNHTIREGNSVISDPGVHPKAFDWQAAFP